MDPDEVLRQMREAIAVAEVYEGEGNLTRCVLALHRAVDYARALDDWMGKAGRLPGDWQRYR
jgi:hypothetical protein